MDYSFQGGDTSQCLTRSVPRVQLPRLREVTFSFCIPFFLVFPPKHSLVSGSPFSPSHVFLRLDTDLHAHTQAEILAQARTHTYIKIPFYDALWTI